MPKAPWIMGDALETFKALGGELQEGDEVVLDQAKAGNYKQRRLARTRRIIIIVDKETHEGRAKVYTGKTRVGELKVSFYMRRILKLRRPHG